MIVKTLEQTENTERHVKTENWDSVRLLLSSDNMGFSFHITTIRAGAELTLQYLNHFESVYCISGEGSIEDLATDIVHEIKPGTVYALDKHDKHILRATVELKLACVFNPPITGQEVHDDKGSYPPASSS